MTHLITVKQVVNAPLEKVWEFWTDPSHIIKWNTASSDWHTTKVSNDLRINGRFSSRMEAKNESTGFDFSGVYTEVVPLKLIKYELDDKRKVKIMFNKNQDKIEIIEEFEAEDENSIEHQKYGWQYILDNFKKYLEININQ